MSRDLLLHMWSANGYQPFADLKLINLHFITD